MKDTETDQPTISEQDGVRYLHFDSPWVQGAMHLRQPARLVLSYTEQMMAWLLFLELKPHEIVGQLGLGAGALTRYCYRYLENPLVVIERNAKVIAACEQYFRLPRNGRVDVVLADAQDWVQNASNANRLSVLMVDLYDAQASGPVCDSREFYQGCADTLLAPGVLCVNLFGQHASFERNIEHLKQVFGQRLLFLPPVEQGNQIVLAFKGPVLSASKSQLIERAQWLAQHHQLPAMRWARSIGSIEQL
jgi:spermidine synthase